MRRTRIASGGLGGTSWELAVRTPDPRLAPYVRDLMGYRERAAGVLRRREFPGPIAVLIFELGDLGPPIRIHDRGTVRTFPAGFVAGVGDGYTDTEHDGLSAGIQCNLTPIGARLVFGVPMAELAGRVLPFPDVAGRAHAGIAERLGECRGWEERLDVVERLLLERLVGGSPRVEMVAWAVAQIEAAGGSIDIRALADELGYSHKHTIELFREHVGVPPKLYARIVRFDRLMRHLRSGGRGSWAELAGRFGYYDQAHLVRDVRQFAGVAPTEARGMLLDFSALQAAEVNSIQDPGAAAP